MNVVRPALLLTLLCAAAGAFAQPSMAERPCGAASAASASSPGCGGPAGHGPRARGKGAHTAEWRLMTPQERSEHAKRMAGFTNYDECKSYLDHHHEEMAARAKERGRALPAQPRHDACMHFKTKAPAQPSK